MAKRAVHKKAAKRRKSVENESGRRAVNAKGARKERSKGADVFILVALGLILVATAIYFIPAAAVARPAILWLVLGAVAVVFAGGRPSKETNLFLKLIVGVTLVLAAIVSGAIFLPKLPYFRGDMQPWLTVEERLMSDPETGAKGYPYRPKEVDRWVAGVKRDPLKPVDLSLILREAVKNLQMADATRVIEAAFKAQPAQDGLVRQNARELRKAVDESIASDRLCAERLTQIIGDG